MSIKGIDDWVYLNEADHRYYNRDGEEYMSSSKFRALFKEPFDKNAAYNCAGKTGYEGMTPEEVLQQWSDYGTERADEGTRIHKAIELFFDTATVLPENEHYRPGLLNIANQYSEYYRTYNEVIVYDNDEKKAGTIDKPLITTSSKNSIIDLTDYKTNIKGIKQKKYDKHGKPTNKYMLHCLSHLQDCTYNDYALQLSDYGYMVEKLTGRRIGQLTIHYVHPENLLINYKIPVPYMKLEIMAMLEWRKKNAVPIKEFVPAKSVLNNFGNDFLNEM